MSVGGLKGCRGRNQGAQFHESADIAAGANPKIIKQESGLSR